MLTTPTPLIVFLLVFARVTALLAAAPIFGERSIPPQIRVGLGAIIALLLTPAQMRQVSPVASDPASLVILLGEQVLLGLAFALIFTVVFRAAESAGELIGQQMGVTLAGWLRPGADGEMHSIAQIYHIVAGLIFLALDGQHWIILTLGASLNVLPVTKTALSPDLLHLLMPLGASAIAFALTLALPVIITLLLADLITGLLGRAMPSLNMFVLGLPLKVALGIGALIITAPLTVALLTQILRYLETLPLWH